MDNHYYVQVTFDFDESCCSEKDIFLDYLSTEHWINMNNGRNWKIGFKKHINSKEKIQIIKEDLKIATAISKINGVDYAVIFEDTFFIDRIN